MHAGVWCRADPPEQCTLVAVQEVLRVLESGVVPPSVDPVKDMHVQDVDLVQDWRRARHLEQTLPSSSATLLPDFEQQVLSSAGL